MDLLPRLPNARERGVQLQQLRLFTREVENDQQVGLSDTESFAEPIYASTCKFVRLQEAINKLGHINLRDDTYLPIKEWQGNACVICYEDFALHDAVTYLPCAHILHSDCIRSWLNSIHTVEWKCPECRAGVFNEEQSTKLRLLHDPSLKAVFYLQAPHFAIPPYIVGRVRTLADVSLKDERELLEEIKLLQRAAVRKCRTDKRRWHAKDGRHASVLNEISRFKQLVEVSSLLPDASENVGSAYLKLIARGLLQKRSMMPEEMKFWTTAAECALILREEELWRIYDAQLSREKVVQFKLAALRQARLARETADESAEEAAKAATMAIQTAQSAAQQAAQLEDIARGPFQGSWSEHKHNIKQVPSSKGRQRKAFRSLKRPKKVAM